jgi:hypothetical protein
MFDPTIANTAYHRLLHDTVGHLLVEESVASWVILHTLQPFPRLVVYGRPIPSRNEQVSVYNGRGEKPRDGNTLALMNSSPALRLVIVLFLLAWTPGIVPLGNGPSNHNLMTSPKTRHRLYIFLSFQS